MKQQFDNKKVKVSLKSIFQKMFPLEFINMHEKEKLKFPLNEPWLSRQPYGFFLTVK